MLILEIQCSEASFTVRMEGTATTEEIYVPNAQRHLSQEQMRHVEQSSVLFVKSRTRNRLYEVIPFTDRGSLLLNGPAAE